MKPTITYLTKDAISTFIPEERDCYGKREVNLTYLAYEFGYRYGMNNCLIDKEISEIIWNCRCLAPFFYNDIINDYLPFIETCSGKNLYCANKRLESLGFQLANHSVPEALESPDFMGNETYNLTKPDHIKCLSSCEIQDNDSQMTFVQYPQKGNFFYQKTFCDVASHIWQKTCQDENRKHFMEKDHEKLCPLLKDFNEYFGGMDLKENYVRTILTL